MSKKIGKILIDVIPKEHHWKITLLSHWEAIIGNLKEKVRIEKITNNSLTLGVCHSTWAQELYFLSPLLKKKINVILKSEKIKNIKFKTVDRTKGKKSFQGKKTKVLQESICHQEHSLTILEHSKLQTIENPELAHVLEQFYLRCKTIKQKK